MIPSLCDNSARENTTRNYDAFAAWPSIMHGLVFMSESFLAYEWKLSSKFSMTGNGGMSLYHRVPSSSTFSMVLIFMFSSRLHSFRIRCNKDQWHVIALKHFPGFVAKELLEGFGQFKRKSDGVCSVPHKSFIGTLNAVRNNIFFFMWSNAT